MSSAAFLNPEVAQYAAFVYTEEKLEEPVDLRDYGNLDTRLEPYRRRLPSELDRILAPIREIGDVEAIERSDGELSLRVRGMEFARTSAEELRFGLERKRAGRSRPSGGDPAPGGGIEPVPVARRHRSAKSAVPAKSGSVVGIAGSQRD